MSEMLEPEWIKHSNNKWAVSIEYKNSCLPPIWLIDGGEMLKIEIKHLLPIHELTVVMNLIRLYENGEFHPPLQGRNPVHPPEQEAGFDYQEWGRKVYALGLKHGEKRAKDEAMIEAWIEEAKGEKR